MVWAKTGHVKGGGDSVITRKVHLVGIWTNLLKDLKWTIRYNLDLRLLGNLSFLRWIQTKSPGWKWTSFLCLLPWSLACSLNFLILSVTLAWRSWISLAPFLASQLNLVGFGIGKRSNGVLGLLPYTTWKGQRFVALLSAQLKANSVWQFNSSHLLMLFFTRTRSKVPKARLVTSIWPSIYGWHVVLNLRWVPSFLHNVSQKWFKNSVSWSEIMLLGMPWSCTISLK